MSRGGASAEQTLARATAAIGAGPDLTATLERLLDALAAEVDPPTTVRERDTAAAVHVADSLVGLEVEEIRLASRVADIGTGAGFPGLPLAAALPNTRFDLVESLARKCTVVERLALAAGIENVKVVAARAEDLASGTGRGSYGAVTVRAVAPLAVLAEYAAPLLAEGGVLVAWKGGRDHAEEQAAVVACEELGLAPRDPLPVTPYPESRHRHLYVYSKVRETPERYPRRPGIALKRPLEGNDRRPAKATQE